MTALLEHPRYEVLPVDGIEERAREAAETGAETLAVACPFCTVMLDDGVKANGADMRVADVSTLLAEALEEP